ncbi:MAG: NAD(P)-dependent oxidoreductase, partial [Candidatus Thermoplasmatota archaeon]
SNKTLGVIGAGRIGTAFALKSKGFDMDVLYVDHSHNEKLEETLDAKKVDLDELVKKSDFISIHVPLTDETHHMITEKHFKMMKETAVIINTSRGPVINEKTLIKALKKGWIFSAGLDVYENEPEVPNALKQLDNVVLLPHIGSASFETRSKMAEMAAENMLKGLKGGKPPNCVNEKVFS